MRAFQLLRRKRGEGGSEKDVPWKASSSPLDRHDPQGVSLRGRRPAAGATLASPRRAAGERGAAAGHSPRNKSDSVPTPQEFLPSAMGRRRALCLQPYFLWLGCVALWAHGSAGQQRQGRPALGADTSRYSILGSLEGGTASAAAANRVRRRGQQDMLRG